MSLRKTAAHGAAWNIALNLVARAAGLVGTLWMTRFIAPEIMGEVIAASALAFSGSWLTAWGFNRYLVVRGSRGREHVFHVTVLHLGTCTVALLLIYLLRVPLGRWFAAPNLAHYLPGMLLAVWLRRLASVPDKQLLREMRFRTIAIATASGELLYVALALLLVSQTSLGGMAIVLANIAQAALMACVEITATGWRSWLTPVRLQWQQCREILRFGAPLAVEAITSECARSWDKLLFLRLFGPAPTALYNLGYNLCDLPATYVGEEVATVLFPTLVKVEASQRNKLFCESVGLLSVVVLPMAAGIACVANELVGTVLAAEWRGLQTYLVVIAAMAAFRPLSLVIASLLLATERNRLIAAFETLKLVVLLAGMWGLSHWGPVPAAGAVALAFAAQSMGLLWALSRGAFSANLLWREIRGSLLATLVMTASVLALKWTLQSTGWPDAMRLVLLIATGVATYAIATHWLAPQATARLRRIFLRTAAGSATTA
jgi:PST family polysaccharide transporter